MTLRKDCRKCKQPLNRLKWFGPTKEGEPGFLKCDICHFKNWMLPEELEWDDA